MGKQDAVLAGDGGSTVTAQNRVARGSGRMGCFIAPSTGVSQCGFRSNLRRRGPPCSAKAWPTAHRRPPTAHQQATKRPHRGLHPPQEPSRVCTLVPSRHAKPPSHDATSPLSANQRPRSLQSLYIPQPHPEEHPSPRQAGGCRGAFNLRKEAFFHRTTPQCPQAPSLDTPPSLGPSPHCPPSAAMKHPGGRLMGTVVVYVLRGHRDPGAGGAEGRSTM